MADLHTDPRWSAETEQGVVVAIYRAMDGAGYGAMPRPDGVFDPSLRDARAALTYLAEHGLLLPDGGETREAVEWRVAADDDGDELVKPARNETFADVLLDEWADAGLIGRKERRVVTTYAGPWEPVE